MRALIIDDNVKKRVAEVIAFASTHVYSLADMMAISQKKMPIPGDLHEFLIDIPMGYTAVYTMEQQLDGLYHHLSISVDAPGKLPSIPSAMEICQLFGMEPVTENQIYNFEDISPTQQAISIHEKIK